MDEALAAVATATVDELAEEDRQEALRRQSVLLMTTMPLKEWVYYK